MFSQILVVDLRCPCLRGSLIPSKTKCAFSRSLAVIFSLARAGSNQKMWLRGRAPLSSAATGECSIGHSIPRTKSTQFPSTPADSDRATAVPQALCRAILNPAVRPPGVRLGWLRGGRQLTAASLHISVSRLSFRHPPLAPVLPHRLRRSRDEPRILSETSSRELPQYVSAIGASTGVEQRTGCKSSCTGRTQLPAQRRKPGRGRNGRR
jgi:hypothetical protein